MAKNKITIDVMVNGKMEKATVSAKKLKKALDGAQNSQEQLNTSTRKGYRAAQGTAQNTANSTKAFSKQAGVVGGLVPVYATFAANVFAISAAFGQLRRAAALDKLESSLKLIGLEGGKNLPAVAQDLRDITDAAISTEQALRATSVASASGFSQTQLVGLTKVAKGASLALGRDLGDALDRLVRGTAKLEPEILDELGIIVRIDKASADYAATLGKVASELTQFEKTQAFVNATITQGIDKYDSITEAIETNPYDKLAASFDNLTKTIINFANSGLNPLVDFFATNSLALTGALVLFGNTLVKQVVPAVDDVIARQRLISSTAASEAKKATKVVAGEYQKIQKSLKTLDFSPKIARDLVPKIKAGTASVKELDLAILSLTRSEKARSARTRAGFDSNAQTTKYKAETAAIREQMLALEALKTAERTRVVTTTQGQNLETRSRMSDRNATAISVIDTGGIGEGVKEAGQATKDNIKEIGKAKGVFGKFGAAVTAVTSSLGLFFRVGLRLIPWIGTFMFAFSAVPESWKFWRKEIDEVTKSVDKSIDRFTTIGESMELLRKRIEDNNSAFTNIFDTLKVGAGVFEEVGGAINRASEAQNKNTRDKIDQQLKDLAAARQQLKNLEGILAQEQARLDNESANRQERRQTGAQEFREDRVDTSPTARSDDIANERLAAQKKLINDTKTSITELDTELTRLFDRLNTISVANATDLVNAALNQSGDLIPSVTRKLNDLKAEIESGSDAFTITDADGNTFIDVPKLQAALAAARSGYASLEGNVKVSTESIANFTKEVNKLSSKKVTPFDGILEQSEEITKTFKAISLDFAKGAAEEVSKTGKLTDGTLLSEATLDQLKSEGGAVGDAVAKSLELPVSALQSRFPAAVERARFIFKKLEEDFDEGTTSMGQLEDAQIRYNDKLAAANKILRIKLGVQATEEAKLKQINKLRESGAAIIPFIQQQEDAVVDSKINALTAQRAIVDLTLSQEERLARNANLDAQILALQVSKKTEAEKNFELIKAQVDERKQELDVVQKTLDAERKSADLALRRFKLNQASSERIAGQSRTSAFDQEERRVKAEIAALQQELANKRAGADREIELKKKQVALEYILLDAKYAYLEAEAKQTALNTQLAIDAAEKEGKNTDKLQEILKAAKSSEGRLGGLRDDLGAKKVTINAKTGKIEGIDKGTILERIFGNISEETLLSIDELEERLKLLKQELADFDTVEMAFQAGFDTMSTGLSSFITDTLNGVKSVKEAFADLATDILKSMQKVFADKLAQQFMGFLEGKLTGENAMFGGAFSRLFKPKGTEQATPKDPLATGGYSSESIDDQINSVAGGVSAVGGSAGIGGGGLDGLGLGASMANPVYVTMVNDPLAGAAGAVAGASEGSGVATVAGGGAAGGQEGALQENTEATKQLTLNTASMVTGTLATVAALTGNEKAAAALALITAGLQAIQLIRQTFEIGKATKDIAVEAKRTSLDLLMLKVLFANTLAVKANTIAILATAAIPGARTGGILSNGKKMAGYSAGGIAKGANGGYPAILHGTEAVVPLPNGKSIPVEMSGSGGGMQQNNVNVNVVMNNDGNSKENSQEDSREMARLGKNISIAVQEELRKQKRNGGMLSPYGSA